MSKNEIVLWAFLIWIAAVIVVAWVFELIGQYMMCFKVKILRLMLWGFLWSIILFSASFLICQVTMPRNGFAGMEAHFTFFVETVFVYALGGGMVLGNIISLLKQEKEHIAREDEKMGL